jgi:hypothetical protein|tara:strand:- start:157 stop:849 length:693 start_codon:yes stop_codon:yes gene_type:complete
MDLTTPREIDPKNLDHWSPEIEQLLSEWGEIALCYAWIHNFSTRKYQRKNHNLAIPIIVLSTLTGVGNFATDSYIPEGYKQGFSAFVGGLNIFCGILGTLQSFLRYAQLYESHRMSALSWASLGRNIQIELALAHERRKPSRDFLKVARAQLDALLESSPTVDQDVITLFNKKFTGKYPHITKPLIVNGLQEVKVYTEKKTKPEPEPQPEPEPEPEPQPEPEPEPELDQP